MSRMPILIAILPLLACTPEEEPAPTREEVLADIEAQGPHAVGWSTFEITLATPGSDDLRTIPVEVWFPSDASGTPDAVYTVSGVAEVPSEHAFRDPAPANGTFPLAVYSHGSGGVGMLAYPFAERMASHGWVVVAPEHVGNTALDAAFGGSDPFGRIALNRPLDIHATLDAAEAGFDGSLDGAIDASSTFLFGHSFGGWTTLAVAGATVDLEVFRSACGPASSDPTCQLLTDPEVEAAFAAGFRDERITTIAPQAPALFRDDLSGVQQPALLQSGFRDQTTRHESTAVPVWEGLSNDDDLWIDLREGGHFSFISICEDLGIEAIEVFQSGATEDGCGPDFTPVPDVLTTLTTWMLAFADRHVLGDETMQLVLDGTPDLPDTRLVRASD